MSLRRRVSRRVIKSTFDESFEYDLPLPKNSILKRSINTHPTSRLRRDVRDAAKKIVQHSRPAMKSKVKRSKTIAKLAVSRAAETLNKKEKNLMKPSRIRVREAVLSSGAKLVTERELTKERNDVKKRVLAENNLKRRGRELHTNQITSRSVKSESAFDSEEWQPVVNLEKLKVDARKRSIASSNTRMPSTRLRSRTTTPGTARKSSVSDDSLMLTSDSESEKESSSNISLDEELKGLDSSTSSSSDDGDGNDTGFEDLNKSKSSVLESPISQSSMNKPNNDSVLEDWPEDSSDSSDLTDKRFHDENLQVLTNIKSECPSDWSTSHVSQLLDLQEHFTFITNNLQNSLEDLKTVIEDKNVVIDAFKTKLLSYTGNEYHQMLEKVLKNCDESDPKSPAAQIIQLLRKFTVSEK